MRALNIFNEIQSEWFQQLEKTGTEHRTILASDKRRVFKLAVVFVGRVTQKKADTQTHTEWSVNEMTTDG